VGLDALFCWLAFQAVGAPTAFPVVLYGYTFYNLAYLLPTPPGQIGSNELIGLLVFAGLCGINRAAVAAMFLFSHPWTALLMAGSGLLALSAMGLSVRQTLALARSPGDRRRALRAPPAHESGLPGIKRHARPCDWLARSDRSQE
jgi:hypothetical protein